MPSSVLLCLHVIVEVLERKLSIEHAQVEHSFQAAMETLRQERDHLTQQLESQVQANINFVK